MSNVFSRSSIVSSFLSVSPLQSRAEPLPARPDTQPLPEAIAAMENDRLRPREACHNLDLLAQVMADLHRLEMDRLIVTHECNLHTASAQDQRCGRQPEGRLGTRGCKFYVGEHAGQQAPVVVRDLDFRQ